MDLIQQVLESYLAAAKENKFEGVAISVVGPGDFIRHDWADSIDVEQLQLKSLSMMQEKLKESIANFQLPEQDLSLDASYASYDIGQSPEGFDFVTWLVLQEMIRVAEGAPAPLKVAVFQGRNPLGCHWVDKVYKPAIGFVGGVYDDKALHRIGFKAFTYKPIVQLIRAGHELPLLKPAKNWDLPAGVVTITLRETGYWTHRNSNLFSWMRLAAEIEKKGDKVVFVRDTLKADEPVEGFQTCSTASRDLDARMWLYDRAKCNLFVSNGPFTLASFTKVPFLCFIPPEPDGSRYEANTPKFWRQRMGIEIGEQFPWFTEKQRIVWARDDYDNLKKAYDELAV